MSKNSSYSKITEEDLDTGCEQVKNIVATVSVFHDEIDDMKEEFNIIKVFRDDECEISVDKGSEDFSGVEINLSNNTQNGTVKLFESGKMVFLGFKSRNGIDACVHNIEQEIQKVNIPHLDKSLQLQNKEIVNIQCTYDTKTMYNLATVSVKFINQSVYEPESFAAAQIWPKELDVDGYISVFKSGSINIIGVTTVEEINTLKQFVDEEIKH